MLVYFALGDAKVWRWGSKPTLVPNANGFASQCNIGLRVWSLVTGTERGLKQMFNEASQVLPLQKEGDRPSLKGTNPHHNGHIGQNISN